MHVRVYMHVPSARTLHTCMQDAYAREGVYAFACEDLAHLHARLLRVARLSGANRAAARVDLAPRDHPAQRKGWAVVAPAAITVAAAVRAARRGCLVGAVGLAALATRADSPTDEGAARRVAAPGRVVALLLQLDDAIAAGGGGGGALTVRVARAGAARRVEARPTDLCM